MLYRTSTVNHAALKIQYVQIQADSLHALHLSSLDFHQGKVHFIMDFYACRLHSSLEGYMLDTDVSKETRQTQEIYASAHHLGLDGRLLLLGIRLDYFWGNLLALLT